MARTESETTLTTLLEALAAAQAAFRRVSELPRLAEQAEAEAKQAGWDRRDAEAALARGGDPAVLDAALAGAETRQRAAERRAAAYQTAVPEAEQAAIAAAEGLRAAFVAARDAELARLDLAVARAAEGYRRAAAAALAVAGGDPFDGIAGPGWGLAKLPTTVRAAWGGSDALRIAGPGAEPAPPSPMVAALREAGVLAQRGERLRDRLDRQEAARATANPPARTRRPVVTEEIPTGDD
ncbi:hypothetical protein RQ734_02795 [Roseomonas mucosa]|uniref:hypothetical protein n=1 Tax=Roseomonas mucosa TaxID=207340 RepID=UPI00208F94C6|nr:hypothetical protein [Roseomonas mucosa]MDT8274971.1 hypothetical protein [Roseomonas mucosa]USQ70693.1 hypothetical protein NF552_14355 [Roseomonas mucosa]